MINVNLKRHPKLYFNKMINITFETLFKCRDKNFLKELSEYQIGIRWSSILSVTEKCKLESYYFYSYQASIF